MDRVQEADEANIFPAFSETNWGVGAYSDTEASDVDEQLPPAALLCCWPALTPLPPRRLPWRRTRTLASLDTCGLSIKRALAEPAVTSDDETG